MRNLATLILSLLLLPLSWQTENPTISGYIRSRGAGRISLHLVDPEIEIRLRTVNTLVSPRYSVWVRNGRNTTVDRTQSFPTCIYSGGYFSNDLEIQVSVSTCSGEVVGTVELDGVQFTLVTRDREKREAPTNPSHEDLQIVIIQKSDSDHKCGINSRNKKRLMVEDRPVIRLSEDVLRKKRATKDRYIELAVFIDSKMYDNVENNKQPGETTLQKIQDIVFAYLNAVQIIYQSSKLTNKLKLVLLRLDIMQTPDPSLNTNSGEIEKYLEAFCGWQQGKNPGDSINGDIDNDDHWDHALLLTGYNLFDGTPDRDSVIGLAWVSGMCHPDYSCTINEGNNFESVYVIAHEMGHNLGMNHDGETGEGNSCDPNLSLMSPVLGPGKVSWSLCSDKELNGFLNDLKTKAQAMCLNDVPTGLSRYDFSLGGKQPGEKFKAIDQCRQAFGSGFSPYVKTESPFEDLCRELWCSNVTHALRAHPALEGTDCSSKPYPYGSICTEGLCSPFSPIVAVPVGEAAPPPTASTLSTSVSPNSTNTSLSNNKRFTNGIDDCPAWYDPLFTKVFTNLRLTYVQENPSVFLRQSSRNLRTHQLVNPEHTVNLTEDRGNLSLTLEQGHGASWRIQVQGCPVDCGGGWAEVEHSCEFSGEKVEQHLCQDMEKPVINQLPCGTNPCNNDKV